MSCVVTPYLHLFLLRRGFDSSRRETLADSEPSCVVLAVLLFQSGPSAVKSFSILLRMLCITTRALSVFSVIVCMTAW